MLRQAPRVMVRPMAGASLALVDDGLPIVLDAMCERIMAVCDRPIDRAELTDVLCELPEYDQTVLSTAIDQLIGRGLLLSS